MKWQALFPLLLLLSACGRPALIDQEIRLPEHGWAWAAPLEWPFEVEDTLAIYQLLLTVTHEESFRFQNCYVQFHTGFPDGEEVSQVVSLDLQTAAGRWLGKCRSEQCTYTIPIQTRAFFNKTGRHTLRLEQYMRQDSIPGLLAFQLRIEDTGERRPASTE